MEKKIWIAIAFLAGLLVGGIYKIPKPEPKCYLVKFYEKGQLVSTFTVNEENLGHLWNGDQAVDIEPCQSELVEYLKTPTNERK